jgi:hypothetical protein
MQNALRPCGAWHGTSLIFLGPRREAPRSIRTQASSLARLSDPHVAKRAECLTHEFCQAQSERKILLSSNLKTIDLR